MRDAFRWSGYIRDFLTPLPLLSMVPSRTIVTSTSGEDACLYQAGEVYAIKIQWVERTSGKDDLGRSGNDDEDQVVQRLVMTVVPGLDLDARYVITEAGERSVSNRSRA